MADALGTVERITIYRTLADAGLEDWEHGDLIVVRGTPGLWMWFEELPGNGAWVPVGVDAQRLVELESAVTVLSARLARLIGCIASA